MSLLRLLVPASRPTRRIAVSLGGLVLNQWTSVSIVRDLGEISGSFEVELRDGDRSVQSWPYATPIVDMAALEPGLSALVTIDGEPVLKGWVDDVSPDADERSVSVRISGRDVTGDLVDCAAAPLGPSEYRNLTLTDVARRICEPFGIEVRADVDVGDPFPRYAIDAGETALSAIEKGARQRGVLVTSDGVGALVLTRSGSRRAPAPLILPGNIVRSAGLFSFRERFSDYFVKGQAEGNGGARGGAKLDGTAAPLAPSSSPPASEGEEPAESGGVLIMGHAQDPEVTRWRPTVAMTRTQATAKSAQVQAEWMMRTRRAAGEKLDYTVRDWRAGPELRLWRPNEIVSVTDAWQNRARDMLVAGVNYTYSERGEETRMRLTGPEAYDLEPVGERRKRRRPGRTAATSGLDGTAERL